MLKVNSQTKKEKVKPVLLSTLLQHKKIKSDDTFTWVGDHKRLYSGIILEDGGIYCEKLHNGYRFSPSSFCEAVQSFYNKSDKSRISGHEKGLINGIPLVNISDEYRRENGMATRKRQIERLMARNHVTEESQRVIFTTEVSKKQKTLFSQEKSSFDLEVDLVCTEDDSCSTLIDDIREEMEQREINTSRVVIEMKEEFKQDFGILTNIIANSSQDSNKRLYNIEEEMKNLSRSDFMKTEQIRILSDELLKSKERLSFMYSKQNILFQNPPKEKTDTYPTKKKVNDKDKLHHNMLFVRSTIAYYNKLFSGGDDSKKYVLYLDGEDGRTTGLLLTEIMKEQIVDLHAIIVNNVKSTCESLQKLMESNKYDKTVDVIHHDLMTIFNTSMIIRFSPLISIWIDLTCGFEKARHHFENVLTNRQIIHKHGCILALTWGKRGTSGEFANTNNCVENIRKMCTEHYASFVQLQDIKKMGLSPTEYVPSKYFPQEYGRLMRFIIGHLIFE